MHSVTQCLDDDLYLCKIALQWHLQQGVSHLISAEPVNAFVQEEKQERKEELQDNAQPSLQPATDLSPNHNDVKPSPVQPQAEEGALGSAAAKVEAKKIAKTCQSLGELREAIAGFEGLSIKKTATNMVFSDGNPAANVMVIGEAPGADEDRLGKPFVGLSGQLLDRILASISLDRKAETPEESVYISNILNWRPPGNRTPSPMEIDISLAFIQRHIMLAKPKVLLFCGGVSAKALLGRTEGILKLRSQVHSYEGGLSTGPVDHVGPISGIATYHPAYLLRSPAQKKLVWADMLLLKDVLGKI